MIYREPRELVIRIEDSSLAQVHYYWTYYGKPCDLIETAAKTDKLTAIFLNMNNPDAGSFVYMLCDLLKARMYDRHTYQPLSVNDVFL
ncbi:hypothetical protein DW182_15735 [Bacteroides sp. AM16-24]|uniref:hypothetical protein n=1 Tax=Bacteroides sp. AM16-24 TaxID=2292002 RepID=UPI000E47510B|nr:hypothetical protein [Bacteroides sp. AM16-24]RHI05060.1 hypothetical protein DW182_15735 [Bacteroides sp. AM16-24]